MYKKYKRSCNVSVYGSVIWLKEAKKALMIFDVKQSNMETGV